MEVTPVWVRSTITKLQSPSVQVTMKESPLPVQPAPETDPAQALSAGSNEDRIAYLQSFGWQVQETPTETQEVRIPEEVNDVFTRYNQLQQSQGFDLSRYGGKAVKRYVYTITNSPGGSQDHCATVLVYRNKIIGGDVASRAEGGRMHGFAMPQT